jgi:DNA polymerase III epsilon subunit-like protein
MQKAYAVIDFETTGLHARGHDRVVEVGVALLRHDLSVEGTWSSVINPERDLGRVLPAYVRQFFRRLLNNSSLCLTGEFLLAITGRLTLDSSAQRWHALDPSGRRRGSAP